MQERDNAVFGMEGCIVENDGIAGAEFWDERLFQPFQKEVSIAIAAEDDRGDQASIFQPRDEIDAFAGGAIAGFLRFTPLPFGSPTARIGLVAVHTRLVRPDALVFGDLLQCF